MIDWGLTIILAAVAVLIFQAEVAKPYRIPSPSMEPTLHCAKPVSGCQARIADRVIANRLVYRFHAPRRGEIVVFKAPAQVESVCGTEGTYIKRLVGLPGERVSMRNGYVFINGVRLDEPYLRRGYRDGESGEWATYPSREVFRPWRQPRDVMRLAAMGLRASEQHHRPSGSDLLAAQPGRRAVGTSSREVLYLR